MSCTLEQKKEAIGFAKADLKQQEMAGANIDDAWDTLMAYEKAIGHPVKMKNIANQHAKKFDEIASARVEQMNEQKPEIDGMPVTVQSGYRDVNDNVVYSVTYGAGKKEYPADSTTISLDQDNAYFGSRGKKVPRNKEHIELKNAIWNNPEEAMKLFDELVGLDSTLDAGYVSGMRELLKDVMDETTPIMNEFKVYIDRKASENMGMAQVNRKDSEIVLNVNEYSATVDKGGMSAVEVYMHEMMHMSIEAGRQFKKGAVFNAIDSLNALKDQAAAEVKWQDLVVVDSAEGKAAAKKMWKQMFDSKDGLSEFVALGMTNPAVMAVLKGREVKERKGVRKGDSMWDYMAHAVIQMYEGMRNFMSAGRGGVDMDERLRWLTEQLWSQNSLAVEEGSLTAQIQENAGKAISKVDSALLNTAAVAKSVVDSTLEWIRTNSGDGAIHQYLSVGKNFTGIFNVFADGKQKKARNTTWSEISDRADEAGSFAGWLGSFMTPEGTAMTISNYLSEDDDTTTDLERVALVNSKLDSDRWDTIASVGGAIKAALGNVSTKQQTALTRVLLSGDMQAISDKYSIDKIGKMLESDAAVDAAIAGVYSEMDAIVGKDSSVGNYYKSQAMGLGHVLATGEGISAVYDTAAAIFYSTTKWEKKAAEVIVLIDQLATLEAIKRGSKDKKALVADMIADNPKGTQMVMAVHKVYLKKEAAHAEKVGVKIFSKKGEIKDATQPGMDSKVAKGDAATVKTMRRKGYRKQEETAVKGLFLYTSTVKGMPGYEKQAFAKINEQKRLHNIIGVMNQEMYADRLELPQREYDYMSDEELSDAKKKLAADERDRLDRHRDVQDQFIADQNEDRQKAIDAMYTGVSMPVVDGYTVIGMDDGEPTNYSVTSNSDMLENRMRQDNKAPSMLGKMIAEIDEKEAAVKLNKIVYSKLVTDMTNNYSRGTTDSAEYIELGPDAKTGGYTSTKFSKELWAGAPQWVREQVKDRGKGNQYVAVRRDVARMYFGAKDPSVLDMRLPVGNTSARDMLRGSDFGESVIAGIELGGMLWSEMVSIIKVDIVIKTPAVIISNIVSNIYYSAALGQAPWTVAANQIKMFKATKRYMEQKKELANLKIMADAGMASSGDKIRGRELLRQMKGNPVHPLMKAGMFTTIMEDVRDIDLRSATRTESFLATNKYTSAVIDNTPKIVKDGANALYMTSGTGMFKMLQSAVQYSDFVARANRYNFLVDERGMPVKEAQKTILDEFVNYNRIDTPFIKWMNSMGLAWFTKYTFGANKSLLTKARSNPTAMAAMYTFLDMPNPTDAAAFEKDFGYMFSTPDEVLFDKTKQYILPASSYEVFF